MNGEFLQSMAQASRERVAQARSQCPDRVLLALARSAPAAPPLRLSNLGFDLIAEVKLRSPALGALDQGGEDITARANDYAAAGAAAISVLTELDAFRRRAVASRAGGARAAPTRAGHAQGLSGRSRPGLRGARRGCRRHPRDPAHARAG